MALLKLKLPKELRSNHYLEKFFYKFFPKLEKIKVSQFVSAAQLAVAFNLNKQDVKDFIIASSTVHGFEISNNIYIHPKAPMHRLKQKIKRVLKKQFIK